MSTIEPRERIVRAAKDRAVQNITALSSPVKTAAANKSKRTDRSSYKAFAEQNRSDDDHSESEAHETPTKKTRTTRKTTTLKDRSAVSESRHHATVPKNPANVDTIDQLASENSLFSQILSGQCSQQTVVNDWIESYKKNKDTAMLDLMQFVVRSSGCKAAHLVNNKEILRTKEYNEAINDLIEYYNGDENNPTTVLTNAAADSYPFIQTSFQAKRFKSNFCEFFILLINQCQYSIIYDEFMINILVTFLIALADSQVRAFRHTATLAVLKIMTGLVDVLLALSVTKDACQRQYENERQKPTAKRSQDRIDQLTRQREELEENECEIKEYINFIFKAVAIHRYRDVCDHIRGLCIYEIGEWMRRYPNKFLDDTFLKYIGWTLHDKVADCRLKCLQALQPLYEEDDLLPKLELFTSRFKNRIIEMSLDKDPEVSVNAIKLLTNIIKNNDSALEDKDCEMLYELVYHTNRQIAQAAGEFLNQKLFIKVDNSSNEVEFKRGGKKQSENSTFIRLLVQFLIESELHDHPDYLIDAMWDIHPMLKDWQCMTDLLLEDPLNAEDQMDDTHERYLVEIISACVRQAATGEYPIGRKTTTHRKLTIKETKQANDDRVLLTEHFITNLPLLLTKYIADQEKLVYLLQIPTYFDLSQYTARRQEKSLESLLKVVEEIVNKHNDSDVLDECSRCLAYLCDDTTSIYTKCSLASSTILDDLVSNFNKIMEKMDSQTEVDESEFFPLIIALRRLSCFAENHSIVNYDFIGYTLKVLKWAAFNNEIDSDLATKAMNLTRSVITWNIHKLKIEFEDGNGLEKNNVELIETLAKLTKKYYKLCSKLFVHENQKIAEYAFYEICDLLVLFNVHLISFQPEYKPLVLECTENDLNLFIAYVKDNVFTENAMNERPDSSERIERLHKRRCILTGFCKLVCYNCVSVKHAAEILRFYVRFAGSYGDIMKQLLSHCREISKKNTAKTLLLALQMEYNRIKQQESNNNQSQADEDSLINQTVRLDRTQPDFIGLKELARRFALTFGSDANKSREAFVTIHQDAIRFVEDTDEVGGSRAPVNVPFLELITEFRLIPQDKKLVQAELDKAFARRANKVEANSWLPFYSYRISLSDDPNSTAVSQSSGEPGEAVANGAAKRASDLSLAAQSDSSRMPAPLFTDSPRQRNQRKRKHQFAPSVVTPLRNNHTNADKSHEEDQDEENENADNTETNDYNQHTESTTNDLESLKLSTINHNDATGRVGGRMTRSSKLFVTPQKNLPNNKRSRSPLATNNSINESTDQFNIFSSTVLEPNKLTKFGKKPPVVKSSIASLAIERNVHHAQNETSDNEGVVEQRDDLSAIELDGLASEMPNSKKNRLSAENDVSV